jgi:cob(I)alamin adenosyltransferase
MKYYSGTGDSGHTSIAGGRVSKNNPIINALGDLDELSAFIGNANSQIKDENINDLIKKIEAALYRISAELSGYLKAIKPNSDIKPISDADVTFLEEAIELYTKKLNDLTKFVRPSGSYAATLINICRAVTRRTERSIVESGVASEPMLRYINRLSSLLFVLFRYINIAEGFEEEYF